MKKANRVAICDALMEKAKTDKDIVIVVSDSRGSASLTPFANAYPERTVEVGIAEQDLVGIAAGLASAGKKPFAASPASFLTMRAIEQIKVDVAYSNVNVKLIGISAGVSYGALGMSHHSLQDLAVLSAIPNMRVLVPADFHETKKMMEAIMDDSIPTYIRVGRNPVEEVHENDDFDLEIGKAIELRQGGDLTIIATGEMVRTACDTADLLKKEGVAARVLDMHTIKPLDEEAIVAAAKETGKIITLEEHNVTNGLGAMVAKVVCEYAPCKVKALGLPDESLITGESAQLFAYYGLVPEAIAAQARALLE
ncbi:transketolase family protein [uncultured Dubosiella sp.]|uniref:transketolase family protein n=1 Tax=uncultured Dubosiella sp. TaxID=1937011 RepID=UPI0025998CAE|nr:transketolase C-terminal domain-containing protein [uncultured Dubosiella sp.]